MGDGGEFFLRGHIHELSTSIKLERAIVIRGDPRRSAIANISYLIVLNGGGKVARGADAATLDIDRSGNTDNYDRRFRVMILTKWKFQVPVSRGPKFPGKRSGSGAVRRIQLRRRRRWNRNRACKIFA